MIGDQQPQSMHFHFLEFDRLREEILSWSKFVIQIQISSMFVAGVFDIFLGRKTSLFDIGRPSGFMVDTATRSGARLLLESGDRSTHRNYRQVYSRN